MAKANHALTVLAAPELTVAKGDVKKLQALAIAQVKAVGEMETNAAKCGILSGLTLHRVKASLPYGQFGKWLEQISTSGGKVTVKKSQANNYMRLALVFLEKTKAAKPEMLALPGDQTSLDLADNHAGKQLSAKLEKFCGDLSLNELLIKHNIKAVGLKTELTEGDDTSSDELTPEERAQQEREAAWLAAWNPVQEIRATLTDPNKAQLIGDAAKIEQLKNEVIEINRLLDERLSALRATKI